MERFLFELEDGAGLAEGLRQPQRSNDRLADYIVGFYNCMRLHSTLGNLSPNAFERESAKQKSIDVSERT